VEEYVDRPCPCTQPGWCPHYNLTLVGRLWELSRGADDRARAYRKLWTESGASRAVAVEMPAARALPMPSMFTQAVNFGKAVVRHVVAGCPTVSAEETGRRMALCLACEYWSQGRCTQCGCFTAAKTARRKMVSGCLFRQAGRYNGWRPRQGRGGEGATGGAAVSRACMIGAGMGLKAANVCSVSNHTTTLT
jgi:hypothetical protein